MNHSPDIPWSALEQLVRRDPGRRGIAGFVHLGAPLCAGHLQSAARHVAKHAHAVAIVTGFPILDVQAAEHAPRVAAETDGPPGALYLARALSALDVEVALVSDALGVPLLEAGCDLWGLPRSIVREYPFEEGAPDAIARVSYAPQFNGRTDAWVDCFLSSAIGKRLTHVIAIERPGPSHTSDSLRAQAHNGPTPCEQFDRDVPAQQRNVCHNIRGMPINGYTAKTHRLLEVIAERRLPIATIGMADGGNELGMGSVAWEVLREAIAGGCGGQVACRVDTDFTIIAGVSNWAAYALATAVCVLAGRSDVARPWTPDCQRELIETLVDRCSAVDGVTRRQEPTVDALPLETYLQILAGIRQLCRIDDK